MRGLVAITAVLTVVVLLLPSSGKSAVTSKTHSLATIIQWQKDQIKNQQKIIKERQLWRTLNANLEALVFLDRKHLNAHRSYLRKLQVRLATNIKEYKRSIVHGVSPRLSAWVCIHSYEGAWNANTGNGYYGGLQMDYGFMSSYGSELLNSKGTADKWTPKEQIMVADRAFSTRGYWPWPNTAGYCGLL